MVLWITEIFAVAFQCPLPSPWLLDQGHCIDLVGIPANAGSHGNPDANKTDGIADCFLDICRRLQHHNRCLRHHDPYSYYPFDSDR